MGGRFPPNVGGWGGWFPNKVQTNKKNQITPEIALFDPNFTFCSPKSHKNPDLGEIFQKNFFFYTFPYNGLLTMVAYNV